MAAPLGILFIICTISHFTGQVTSHASGHEYKKGDLVPLYANKVGPFQNPSETYSYFDLPFCSPDHLERKRESLGELLNGDRLILVPNELKFLVDIESQVWCRKRLTKEEVSRFRNVIAQDYYLQMYFDDLPVWAFIGKIDQEEMTNSNEYNYQIFTHLDFEIFHNRNNVIEINLRTWSATDLPAEEEVDLEIKYTVKWRETSIPFEKRNERYLSLARLPHHLRIHGFSIMNSCVTILVLVCVLLTIYVRVLRRDFYKYANEELADNQEETGWKSLHGDVFRYPKHKSLFAAALGSGTQCLTLVACVLILGQCGIFHPYDRGVLLTALVIIYAITSGVAGFTASSFYYKLEGHEWIRNLLLTGCLSYVPLLIMFCYINTVALAHGSTAALPFGTVLVLLLLWILLVPPLIFMGGFLGKNLKPQFGAPCRTTKFPRDIPPQRWYRGFLPRMALGGFLPFSILYIQLYYILASVWGHKIYTMYGILCIVFIQLLIVSALVCIAFTYSQLAAEDHNWWWRSFLCGASTGLYMFGYCFYYYFRRSAMNGLLQTSFFFGYMACICFGISLMLGTVGYWASLLFVRYIYGFIKCD